MKKPSIKFEFRAYPLGVCVKCLEKWRTTGLPGQTVELVDGARLLSVYCVERQTGAYAISTPSGEITEWSMRTPVEIQDWRAYVKVLPGSLAAVAAAVHGS